MTTVQRSFAVLLLLSPLLLGSNCGDYDRNDFDPPTAPGDLFLQLSTTGGATSLPADGLSRLGLTASISPRAASGNRTIVFTTSEGTLLGPGSNAMSQEVAVDSLGRAFIELQASQQVGATAVVTAMVKDQPLVTARAEIRMVDPTEVFIQFTDTVASAPADGATISFFTVQVSSLIPLDQREVTFNTTQGSFDPGTTAVRQTKVVPTGLSATVALYSPSELTSALLTATVDGRFAANTIVQFVRALPDFMTVTVAPTSVKDTLDNDGRVTITATLAREIGDPTPAAQITFEARRGQGTSGALFGFFPEGNTRQSDAMGQAQLVFSTAGDYFQLPDPAPNPLPDPDTATIVARTQGEEGELVATASFLVSPEG